MKAFACSALLIIGSLSSGVAQERPLMMAGQDHSVPFIEDAFRQPNPLQTVIDDARAQAQAAPRPEPTGLTKDDYLDLIDGVVGFFKRYQAERGAIIDPFQAREAQYSTPTYALAAAVLVTSGRRPELLDSAVRALEHSFLALATGTPANRGGDFFILPAMSAYRLLAPVVSEETLRRWDAYVRRIDPDLAYSNRIGPGQPDVINWNTSALAGEYVRFRQGLGNDDFVRRYVEEQLPRFTPEGLYRDPGYPLVYDAAARFNFMLLLEEGYEGPEAPALEVLVERGAWASLLMQSPNGDFPEGGRSSGHVWNDAMQVALFESFASTLHEDGRAQDARMFKRAARLSAGSMQRWVRPSGEFWIVKNRFDPAVRHGFEGYSRHSAYNLLAASYLALAWMRADDGIGEAATPAETASYALRLDRFDRIFANASGRHLALSTSEVEDANARGILRTGTADDPEAFRYFGTMQTVTPLWLESVAWRREGQDDEFVDFASGDVGFEVLNSGGDAVEFVLEHASQDGNVGGVRETYRIDADGIVVTTDLPDDAVSWTIDVPSAVTIGDGALPAPADPEADPEPIRDYERVRFLSPDELSEEAVGSLSDRNAIYHVRRIGGEGSRFSYRVER